MDDWEKRLNLFIEASGSLLRLDAGTVTALEAKIHAEGEYDKYRVIQDRIFQSDYDRFVTDADKIIESLEASKSKNKIADIGSTVKKNTAVEKNGDSEEEA